MSSTVVDGVGENRTTGSGRRSGSASTTDHGTTSTDPPGWVRPAISRSVRGLRRSQSPHEVTSQSSGTGTARGPVAVGSVPGVQKTSCEVWKSGARLARNRPVVGSCEAPTATSSVRPSKITGACAGSVPRRHSRTTRAYPESVASDPSGSSGAARSTVSRSTHDTEHLASLSRKPSSEAGTKRRARRSNSRISTASAPPRDNRSSARSSAGRRTTVPEYTQLTPSSSASASTSTSVSHAGWSTPGAPSARTDHGTRRHSPRRWSPSFHSV